MSSAPLPFLTLLLLAAMAVIVVVAQTQQITIQGEAVKLRDQIFTSRVVVDSAVSVDIRNCVFHAGLAVNMKKVFTSESLPNWRYYEKVILRGNHFFSTPTSPLLNYIVISGHFTFGMSLEAAASSTRTSSFMSNVTTDETVAESLGLRGNGAGGFYVVDVSDNVIVNVQNVLIENFVFGPKESLLFSNNLFSVRVQMRRIILWGENNRNATLMAPPSEAALAFSYDAATDAEAMGPGQPRTLLPIGSTPPRDTPSRHLITPTMIHVANNSGISAVVSAHNGSSQVSVPEFLFPDLLLAGNATRLLLSDNTIDLRPSTNQGGAFVNFGAGRTCGFNSGVAIVFNKVHCAMSSVAFVQHGVDFKLNSFSELFFGPNELIDCSSIYIGNSIGGPLTNSTLVIHRLFNFTTSSATRIRLEFPDVQDGGRIVWNITADDTRRFGPAVSVDFRTDDLVAGDEPAAWRSRSIPMGPWRVGGQLLYFVRRIGQGAVTRSPVTFKWLRVISLSIVSPVTSSGFLVDDGAALVVEESEVERDAIMRATVGVGASITIRRCTFRFVSPTGDSVNGLRFTFLVVQPGGLVSLLESNFGPDTRGVTFENALFRSGSRVAVTDNAFSFNRTRVNGGSSGAYLAFLTATFENCSVCITNNHFGFARGIADATFCAVSIRESSSTTFRDSLLNITGNVFELSSVHVQVSASMFDTVVLIDFGVQLASAPTSTKLAILELGNFYGSHLRLTSAAAAERTAHQFDLLSFTGDSDSELLLSNIRTKRFRYNYQNWNRGARLRNPVQTVLFSNVTVRELLWIQRTTPYNAIGIAGPGSGLIVANSTIGALQVEAMPFANGSTLLVEGCSFGSPTWTPLSSLVSVIYSEFTNGSALIFRDNVLDGFTTMEPSLLIGNADVTSRSLIVVQRNFYTGLERRATSAIGIRTVEIVDSTIVVESNFISDKLPQRSGSNSMGLTIGGQSVVSNSTVFVVNNTLRYTLTDCVAITLDPASRNVTVLLANNSLWGAVRVSNVRGRWLWGRGDRNISYSQLVVDVSSTDEFLIDTTDLNAAGLLLMLRSVVRGTQVRLDGVRLVGDSQLNVDIAVFQDDAGLIIEGLQCAACSVRLANIFLGNHRTYLSVQGSDITLGIRGVAVSVTGSTVLSNSSVLAIRDSRISFPLHGGVSTSTSGIELDSANLERHSAICIERNVVRIPLRSVTIGRTRVREPTSTIMIKDNFFGTFPVSGFASVGVQAAINYEQLERGRIQMISNVLNNSHVELRPVDFMTVVNLTFASIARALSTSFTLVGNKSTPVNTRSVQCVAHNGATASQVDIDAVFRNGLLFTEAIASCDPVATAAAVASYSCPYDVRRRSDVSSVYPDVDRLAAEFAAVVALFQRDVKPVPEAQAQRVLQTGVRDELTRLAFGDAHVAATVAEGLGCGVRVRSVNGTAPPLSELRTASASVSKSSNLLDKSRSQSVEQVTNGSTVAPSTTPPGSSFLPTGNDSGYPTLTATSGAATALVPPTNGSDGTTAATSPSPPPLATSVPSASPRTETPPPQPPQPPSSRSSVMLQILGDGPAATAVDVTATTSTIASSVASPTMATQSSRVAALLAVVSCDFDDAANEGLNALEHPIRPQRAIGSMGTLGLTAAALACTTGLVAVCCGAHIALWAAGDSGGASPTTKKSLRAVATVSTVVATYFVPPMVGAASLIFYHSRDAAQLAVAVGAVVVSVGYFGFFTWRVGFHFNCVVELGSSEAGLGLPQSAGPIKLRFTSSGLAQDASSTNGVASADSPPTPSTATTESTPSSTSHAPLCWTPPERSLSFVEAALPLFDGTGQPASLLRRLYHFEDVLSACAMAAIANARPGGSCEPVAVLVLLVAVAHCAYLLHLRPYRTKLDRLFTTLFAVGQVLLGLVAVLMASGVGEGGQESTIQTVVGALTLLMALMFFVQTIVQAAFYWWLQSRRRARELRAADEAENLAVPMLTVAPSPKSDDDDSGGNTLSPLQAQHSNPLDSRSPPSVKNEF